jgi:hypothetical protein
VRRALAWSALATWLLASACGPAAPHSTPPSGKVTESPEPSAPTSADAYEAFLVTPEDCEQPSPAAVSRVAALDDVDALESILQSGYAGFEELARRGVDWERVMSELRRAVRNAPDPLEVATFQALVADHLRVTHDNHLSIARLEADGRHQLTAGGHQDAYAASTTFELDDSGRPTAGDATLESCDGYALDTLLHPTLGTAPPEIRWVPLVMAYEPPSALRCVFARTDGKGQRVMETRVLELRRLAVTKDRPDGAPDFEELAGPTPRLRLRSLDGAHPAALQAFVESAARLRETPALILDVRDNGGGGDGPVVDWFTALTSGALSSTRIRRLESHVVLQGAVNGDLCFSRWSGLDPEGRADALEGLSRSRARLADVRRENGAKPFREWTTHTRNTLGTAPAPYRGAVVVLANSGCASSCEAVIAYARQLEDTLVVGENTGGVGEFGELGEYRLSGSGLWLRAGSKHFSDSERASAATETVGYVPDVWLTSSTPAVDAAALAGCMARADCRAALERNLLAPLGKPPPKRCLSCARFRRPRPRKLR